MTSRLFRASVGLLILFSWSVAAGGTADLKPSLLETEYQKVKYQFALANSVGAEEGLVLAAVDWQEDGSQSDIPGRKSPTKALILSLAVPGAGQYYYGSRVKPFIFLGAEVAAWALHIKWHNDGVDIQDEFEAFNREHWSRTRYEDEYLMTAYGENDDELIYETEISHRLPDSRTQQYYEMTGKYDQFAWGWDDASRNDSTLQELIGAGETDGLRITGPETTPESANREVYETMRDDSNRKYDRARKMIVVSIVNHLISGIEAYISTRKYNETLDRNNDAFGRLDVRAQLKSYNEPNDTPFLNVSYKF